MKKIIALLFFSLCCFSILYSQQNATLPPLDKSPMDMSYYPNNYPVLKIQNKITEPLVVRVIYSRPQRNDRKIFGDLVEYGKVWRMGANEATEIEFFRHVWIGGKKISKGRYTLYAIPNENNWTIIVNKDTDIWGAFKYDPRKDVVKTEVPVQKNNEPNDALAMMFEKSTDGINLVVAWDTVKISLPIIL